MRTAPTVSPPSQTTGTPPHSSTSPTSQGTQMHKNQLKAFVMSEYVASASVGSHCMRGVIFFLHVSPEYITMVTTVRNESHFDEFICIVYTLYVIKFVYNISYMISFNKAVYMIIAFLVIVLTKEDPTIILSLFMVAIFAC